MGALVGPHNLPVLLEHDAGSMLQQARRGAVGTCRRRRIPMTTERSPPSETGDELLPGPPAGRRTFTAATCAAGESDGEFESHRRLPRADGPCQGVDDRGIDAGVGLDVGAA